MKEIEELIAVTDTLLGPNGCPWDRQQTLRSARKYPLEEASELIDAIDKGDEEHIKEELGDLFFNAVFLSRLAEKEHRFRMQDVIKGVIEKLIRRHPHVFGNVKIEHTDEVVKQWDQIKKQEKKVISDLDSIPKSLSSLARASKILKRLEKKCYPDQVQQNVTFEFKNEEELGALLLQLVLAGEKAGLDAEHALRKVLGIKERAFRKWESAQD